VASSVTICDKSQPRLASRMRGPQATQPHSKQTSLLTQKTLQTRKNGTQPRPRQKLTHTALLLLLQNTRGSNDNN
jgi:hypothetical protein